MARIIRKKSSVGIYHVMLRGVNKQMIFLADADNLRFLQVLQQVKEVSAFALHGYCLMGNHIHLLIQEREEGEPLDKIMQRIQNRFIGWYNLCYERCGPLFGGRFRSEPVEDERYFLTVLRYIHQNPMRAGLSKGLSDYKWSSYHDYADGTGLIEGLVDTDMAFGYSGKKELLRFFHEESFDICVDDHSKSEKESLYPKIFKRIAGECDNKSFKELSKPEQCRIVEACLNAGIPKGKLAKFIGTSYQKINDLKRGLTPN